MTLFMSMFVIISLLGLGVDFSSNNNASVRLRNSVRKYNVANIYLVISMMALFVICAFRDASVGVDTNTYVGTFLNKSILNSMVYGESKFEQGYKIYIEILRKFTDDPQIFIVVTSFILFAGTYIFIKNNCEGSYALSIVIFMAFLYYTYFSAIRQSLALVIAINSFNYIYNRKWFKAVLLILLASLFHYTALILFVFIPFSLTKWTKKKIWIALVAAIGSIFFFERIVEIVIRIFPIYRRYWNSGMMRRSETNSGTFALLVILICAFAFINLFNNKDLLYDEEKRSFYIAALLGSIFCFFINILGLQNGVFSRMTRYFIPYVIVLTVNTYSISSKRIKIPFYFCVLGIMGIYFYFRMKSNVYEIIPYKFFTGGI